MFYANDPEFGFKTRCIGTELKFIFFPKRCYISNKTLWLVNAYRQTAMYTGPGDPVFEHRWYDKTEFLIAKIKGTV
jgi:hypothetical protein